MKLTNYLKRCYNKAKRFLKKLFNQHKISFKCNFKWFGNEYGGFYICPELVNLSGKNEVIVYSAGVGGDISFDIDIIKEFNNCKVFAFDPTPKSIEWIKKQNLPENYKFFPIGIGIISKEEKMYLPKNTEYVSGSIYQFDHLSMQKSINVQMKSFDDIIKENGHKYIDIIKMDIEGSEFSVIENLNFNEIICGQIVVEFHERFFNNGDKLLTKTINILKNNGYYCFAISRSNEEYSFINKEYYEKNIMS